jgi:hypothetical protein
MSGEVSYFSRFFVKFVEIIAAGLASAICAYLLAHFGGVLSPPTPASAPASAAVPVGPTGTGVSGQPTPPLAAAAADEHPATQRDGPEAKLAHKVGKEAKTLPSRKQKIDTSAAEKPRTEKSAEALVRDALANIDANRRTPADAPIGSGVTDSPSLPVDNLPARRAIVSPQQPDLVPRPVEVPARPAVEAVPYPTDVPMPPVQSRPAPSADLPPISPNVRAPPLSASQPLEIAAPQPLPPADHDKDVFSALSLIPNLLRPDPPAANGEPPRPPMPVEKFGN